MKKVIRSTNTTNIKTSIPENASSNFISSYRKARKLCKTYSSSMEVLRK